MFRIRKILDAVSHSNQEAIKQVSTILENQFPLARPEDKRKLMEQLSDPVQFKYRSILLVAEDRSSHIKGFAMLLHMPDVPMAYLELISVTPSGTGGGIGGALYERARQEAVLLNVAGLFFECSVDDADLIKDKDLLKQNVARLRFYERYGARPIINNVYASPAKPGDQDLYYLVFDDLSQDGTVLSKVYTRKVVRAILERKYGELLSKKQIDEVVNSFQGNPAELRPFKYIKTNPEKRQLNPKNKIAIVVNEGHDIHHVKDKGYVEAPVRLSVILEQLNKTGIFERVMPKQVPDKYIKQVHDKKYVDYLHDLCSKLPEKKSIYPLIFPVRNKLRLPKDYEIQAGYYCIDTFTPLNGNAYLAARGAVNCAMTAAMEVVAGRSLAYALVRPPGHHAEKRAFGGFCYFNSASIAANYLSQFGKVAVLDVDFHHGNGTQDIFYDRADVLTVSIHGDPEFAYPHFAGFADEVGEGEGLGFNINYPLSDKTSVAQYQKILAQALKKIEKFKPSYLVLALGLDTAKDDPTGTWKFNAKDFEVNGKMIGEMNMPTLIVQEGGYRTSTLGVNARHFFTGLWHHHKS